ncbi:DUF1579 domain-containing protein [Aeoliella mucimassa]|uniref:DUF1579 domain-containing protein n=1 Tax=Aeoliella mucimassa TaxID=2527972 RepID=A0A518APJ5_9BACT|nr:DUF1579 domain-containing protein [Aeoliella mucimassa]QDU56647.1 hypothetical protein Pan181_28570 [Aeoliella mucimassa]
MYRAITFLSALIVACLVTALTIAQEPPEFPGPEKEHQWLQQFAGEWTTTSKGSIGPDQPPMECSGTIKSRMIGEFWVVNEMKSTIQGDSMQGLQTIGYDASKKKYVGTWVDSMMNHMWIYEGTVDESGSKLTLEAEGPNFMAPGKLTKFRDAYEFKTPDHIIVTSSMLGEDGKWITFMTGDSVRKPITGSDSE